MSDEIKNQTNDEEPRWVCLEGMNKDELAAYDYGCQTVMAALQKVLDGKSYGVK